MAIFDKIADRASVSFGKRVPGTAPLDAQPVPAAKPAAKPAAPVAPVRSATQADGHNPRFDEILKRWHEQLLDSADLIKISPDQPAEELRAAYRGVLSQIAQADPTPAARTLTPTERTTLIDAITAEQIGYGPIEPLLADDTISEIMVNTAKAVYVERRGAIELTPITFRSEDVLLAICRRMVQAVGRTVDTQTPICDARLPDGSRINVTIPPVAIDGTYLTVRKFSKHRLSLADLVRRQALTDEAAEILRIIGLCAVNVIISGGTNSGKTTLLNCISASIRADERVVTCEDTAELQLQAPHVLRHETRMPNSDGAGAITMGHLVRNALRQNPHRIIVGEVRDGAAGDLITAMNSGHSGGMTTIHANDPRGCLDKLETLMRMADGFKELPPSIIRKTLAQSIDIIIQVEKLANNRRTLTHITEVRGLEDGDTFILQDLLQFDRRRGVLRGTGDLRPRLIDRAREFGEAERLVAALAAAGHD
ncbi:CpaF family protein [Xanthobacter sp. V13C-7B]|uniref:CpaF family protein n=1 Tax=Xanthobacter variabilis TaxID=3119932 RepID=UPI00372B5D8B